MPFNNRSRSLDKDCVRYILASLFLVLTESTSETRGKKFFFTSNALSVLEKIKF